PGAPLPCFAFCRSTLSVSNSEIIDNTGNGVYAISVNADIQHTVMSGNGGSGLRVSDARVDPFTWNVIEENGLQAQSAKAVPGVWILAGGDLQMHLDRPNDSYGYNRLANNGSSELTVAAGGTAFIGNSASNGRNSIYNTNQGGVLVANYSGAKLDAVNTFWGSMNAPPAGALAGSVEWDPVSSCDYTVSPPSCVGLQRGVGDAIVAGRGGEEAPLEALRAEILAVRAALAEHPA